MPRTLREIDQEMAGLRLRVRMLKKERAAFIADREARFPELYRSGMLLKHIAEDLGFTENHLNYLVRKLKIAQRRGSKYQAIIDAWIAGEPSSQIAERLGTNRGQIIKVVRLHGLPQRKPGRPPKMIEASL